MEYKCVAAPRDIVIDAGGSSEKAVSSFADSINLENASVSVYLRGDDLNLFNAKCYFWILGNGSRWHNISNSLEISESEWAKEPQKIDISSDESDWHNSWNSNSRGKAPLIEVLRNCESYGFSFVGFEEEVRGKFSMDEFEIKFSK